MYNPVYLSAQARDRQRQLLREAEAERLARAARGEPPPTTMSLRQRLSNALIGAGLWLHPMPQTSIYVPRHALPMSSVALQCTGVGASQAILLYWQNVAHGQRDAGDAYMALIWRLDALPQRQTALKV